MSSKSVSCTDVPVTESAEAEPVTEEPGGLFSHPEQHQTRTESARPANAPRSYAGLFREPEQDSGVIANT